MRDIAPPAGYQQSGGLDLSEARYATPILVAGMALFFLLGWGFIQLGVALRPELSAQSWELWLEGVRGWLRLAVLVLGVTVLMAVLHEAIHGFFFWLYTGKRPRYGVTLSYAYAGVPDAFLRRNQHLVTGLAPLVILTVIGVLLLVVAPLSFLPALLLLLTANAAGAVGDILVAALLLARPADTLVRDTGYAVHFYSRVIHQEPPSGMQGGGDAHNT